MPVLMLLFIVVPLLELAVIIRVGAVLGVIETLMLLLVISVVGAWLAKREGLGVYRRFRQQISEGRVPGAEIVDGVLVICAAALLLTPGFLTDAVALLLLVPPVRASVRGWLRRVAVGRAATSFGPWGSAARTGWRYGRGRTTVRENPPAHPGRGPDQATPGPGELRPGDQPPSEEK